MQLLNGTRVSGPRAAVAGPAVAMLLVACTGPASSPSPTDATTATTPSPSVTETANPTISPTPSSTESPSSAPTDEPDGSGAFDWTEATAFGPEGGAMAVTDVSAWSGGFIAIGHEWPSESMGPDGEPRIWTSPDGRDWEDVSPDLGSAPMELRGILRLSAGGVVVVSDAPGATEVPRARAFRSDDGETWTELDLPTEIANAGGIRVASGPVGHVIATADEIWYSAEAESWQLVHEAPDGVAFVQPVAGEEGFVTWTTATEDGEPIVVASGDGLSWLAGSTTLPIFGVAPWRGDWFGWSFTDDPPSIGLFRSANGLDWSEAADLEDLTGPGGPTANQGMESEVTEMTLAGEGGVLLATLGWNHCCAQLPVAVATYLTTDGEAWAPSGLPEELYVSAVATDGSVLVAAGHRERGVDIGFWVAER